MRELTKEELHKTLCSCAGRDEKWKELFSHSLPNEFKRRKIDYCRNYYRLEENDYKDIPACVENALKMQNHLAFVRYYLEKCPYEDELFGRKLREYVKRIDYTGWNKKNSWFGSQDKTAKLYILNGSIFRDKNYTKKGEKGTCPLPDKNMHEKDRSRSGFVSGQTLRKWYTGEIRQPKDRYAVVQCAFYLHLTVDETNELLNLAGMQALYPVNGMDFLCMLYLEKFMQEHESRTLSTEIINFIYDNYIISLKERINEFLDSYEIHQGFSEKFISYINQNKTDFVYKQDASDHFYADIETDGFIKSNIEKISGRIDSLSKNLGGQYDVNTTLWIEEKNSGKLTEIFKDCLKINAEAFLSKKQNDIFYEEQYLSKFTIGYYEFQRQLFNYLNTIEYYLKNLYYAEIPLVWEENLIPDFLDLEWEAEGKQFLKGGCDKIYKNYLTCTDADKWKAVSAVWNYDMKEKVPSSDFSILYKLFFGRTMKQSGHVRYYKPEIADRKHVIKFCLAAGQEDNISRMLYLAGFRNYTYKDMPHEKTDAFLQYIFAYREALIKKWAESINKYSLRNSFPMIELCRNVNRDIQFTVEYILGCYTCESSIKSIEDMKKIESIIEKILKIKRNLNAKLSKFLNHDYVRFIKNKNKRFMILLESIENFKNDISSSKLDAVYDCYEKFPSEITEQEKFCQELIIFYSNRQDYTSIDQLRKLIDDIITTDSFEGKSFTKKITAAEQWIKHKISHKEYAECEIPLMNLLESLYIRWIHFSINKIFQEIEYFSVKINNIVNGIQFQTLNQKTSNNLLTEDWNLNAYLTGLKKDSKLLAKNIEIQVEKYYNDQIYAAHSKAEEKLVLIKKNAQKKLYSWQYKNPGNAEELIYPVI